MMNIVVMMVVVVWRCWWRGDCGGGGGGGGGVSTWTVAYLCRLPRGGLVTAASLEECLSY